MKNFKIRIGGKTWYATEKTKMIFINVAVAIVTATMIFGFAHFCNNAEMYNSQLRNDLHEAVEMGDPVAVEFYQEHYLDRGIKLW